ncbi:hypothetical protein LINPERPRIM_LOCUS18320 [Linum perenne]
MSSVFCH